MSISNISAQEAMREKLALANGMRQSHADLLYFDADFVLPSNFYEQRCLILLFIMGLFKPAGDI